MSERSKESNSQGHSHENNDVPAIFTTQGLSEGSRGGATGVGGMLSKKCVDII
jgi:hypothetical protein